MAKPTKLFSCGFGLNETHVRCGVARARINLDLLRNPSKVKVQVGKPSFYPFDSVDRVKLGVNKK